MMQQKNLIFVFIAHLFNKLSTMIFNTYTRYHSRCNIQQAVR
jgi:hypothetical protein